MYIERARSRAAGPHARRVRAGTGNEEAYSAGEAVVREVGKGELALIIEAEVLVAGLVAGLVAAQGHGSQVVVGVSKGQVVAAACSSARASGGLACARLRVGGGVRQVEPGAELPAEALGLGAALDLRANTHSFRPASMAVEHVDCQQQRALSRTGRFSSSSKSGSSHGGIVLAEAMGFSVVAVVKGCSCWGCCVPLGGGNRLQELLRLQF